MRFATLCNLIHEFQDVIGGQVVKVIIAKLAAESILNEEVGSDCIFFGMDEVIVDPNFSSF
jgi:hypothetical protein